MTDKNFIYGFLEKNYSLFIDGYGLMFKDRMINESFSSDNFKIIFYKIIGSWDSDEGFNSFDLAKTWYNEKKEILTKDLNDYLKDCEFILGDADWIVKKSDGTIIELDTLTERFQPVYSKEFITHFYGEWYSEKVCEFSEKMMNQW